MDKIEKKRLTYTHKGRKIYEWEQSLEEVQVYIDVPPGVKAKMLDVKISTKELTVGLKGNPPFMNVRANCQLDRALCVLRRVAVAH